MQKPKRRFDPSNQLSHAQMYAVLRGSAMTREWLEAHVCDPNSTFALDKIFKKFAPLHAPELLEERKAFSRMLYAKRKAKKSVVKPVDRQKLVGRVEQLRGELAVLEGRVASSVTKEDREGWEMMQRRVLRGLSFAEQKLLAFDEERAGDQPR